jgi:hypothetical protein
VTSKNLLRNKNIAAPHKIIVSAPDLGLHFPWEKGASPKNQKMILREDYCHGEGRRRNGYQEIRQPAAV